jgi:A/G-specific adenine glycosylase
VYFETYIDLLKLKGWRIYTACNCIFSYNEAVPVVDGNVFRVLSRYFDVETDTGRQRIRCFGFRSHAKDNPAIFNQAIMEFGVAMCS